MRISREGNAIQSKKLYIVYDLRISLRSPIHTCVYTCIYTVNGAAARSFEKKSFIKSERFEKCNAKCYLFSRAFLIRVILNELDEFLKSRILKTRLVNCHGSSGVALFSIGTFNFQFAKARVHGGEKKRSFDFSVLYIRYVSHRSVRSIVRLGRTGPAFFNFKPSITTRFINM